jgi:hypothetical protein
VSIGVKTDLRPAFGPLFEDTYSGLSCAPSGGLKNGKTLRAHTGETGRHCRQEETPGTAPSVAARCGAIVHALDEFAATNRTRRVHSASPLLERPVVSSTIFPRRRSIVSTRPRSACAATACAELTRRRSSRSASGTLARESRASTRGTSSSTCSPVCRAPRIAAFSASTSPGFVMRATLPQLQLWHPRTDLVTSATCRR